MADDSRPDLLLANVERPPGDRPVRVAPEPPELESVETPWLGSATSQIDHWKQRALRAERLVEQLARALARHRPIA